MRLLIKATALLLAGFLACYLTWEVVSFIAQSTPFGWFVGLAAVIALLLIILVPRWVVPSSRSAQYEDTLNVTARRDAVRRTTAFIAASFGIAALLLGSLQRLTDGFELRNKLSLAQQSAQLYSQNVLGASKSEPEVMRGSFQVLMKIAATDPAYRREVYILLAEKISTLGKLYCPRDKTLSEKDNKPWAKEEFSMLPEYAALMRIFGQREIDGDLISHKLDVRHACLVKADFNQSRGLSNTYLPNAILHGVDLRDAMIQNSEMIGVEAGLDAFPVPKGKPVICSALDILSNKKTVNDKITNFDGATIQDSQLYNSGFCGASFERVKFTNTNLGGANFNFANLRNAVFSENANVEGAWFDGADLTNADLRGAKNLNKAHIESACAETHEGQWAFLADIPWIGNLAFVKRTGRPKLPKSFEGELKLLPCATVRQKMCSAATKWLSDHPISEDGIKSEPTCLVP